MLTCLSVSFCLVVDWIIVIVEYWNLTSSGKCGIVVSRKGVMGMDSNDKFVKVGRHNIRIDAIDYVDEDFADVTVYFSGARTLTLGRDNANDMRALFADVRTAHHIAVDREAQQKAFEDLLRLVKDAAEIIREYVGYRIAPDGHSIGDWLARARAELGVTL